MCALVPVVALVALGVPASATESRLLPGHGERSRSQFFFKLGGTENMSILDVNVLAVNFWLLTVPSPSTSCQKCIMYPLSALSEVLDVHLSGLASGKMTVYPSPPSSWDLRAGQAGPADNDECATGGTAVTESARAHSYFLS